MSLTRSINAAICFTLFGIGALFLGIILLPLIYLFCWNKDKQRHLFANSIRKSWQLFIWIMSTFHLIKVNISEQDRQTLLNMKSTIVVANHPSLIDIVILVSLVKNPLCIVKGKLTRNFFMRIIVLSLYIQNNNDPDAMINQADEVLIKGYNLIIFPEGTRSIQGEDLKLQRGAARITLETGYKLLALNINLPEQILGKHQKWYQVGNKTAIYDLKINGSINPSQFKDNGKSSFANARHITDNIKKLIEK